MDAQHRNCVSSVDLTYIATLIPSKTRQILQSMEF